MLFYLPLGPVIGPLVLCGYLIESSRVKDLAKLGVRDSKLLTAKKREALVPKLHALGHAKTSVISAGEIDALRTVSNLNRIEIVHMQGLIAAMRPDRVIIDAPEVNTKQFARKIAAGLEHDCEIVAENFADVNHREVGAASIIAKVTRDEAIATLRARYGDVGSGYATDPRTVAFLKTWLEKKKHFPPFVRASWVTAKSMIAKREQTKLDTFS